MLQQTPAQPSGGDDLKRAVIIPLLQSLVGCAFFTLAGLGICWVAHWPAAWSLVGGALFGLIDWLATRNHWTTIVEKVLGVDLPLIQAETQPIVDQPTTRIEVITRREDDPSYLEGSFMSLPLNQEQLALLAEGIERGMPFSQEAWTGAARPLTRSQFEALRGIALEHGWGYWISDKSRSQGFALNVAGRKILRQLGSGPKKK